MNYSSHESNTFETGNAFLKVTVSVLSTLLVVGIVLGIVIVFNKLKDKVDVTIYENDIQTREIKEIDLIHEISENNRSLYNRVDNLEKELWDTYDRNIDKTDRDIDEIKRLLDSRCDKLYDQIKSIEKQKGNNKQLLTED